MIITKMKQYGDWWYEFITLNISMYTYAGIFAALSALNVGASFVTIGLDETFFKLTNNRESAIWLAFLFGFLIYFFMQCMVVVFSQAATKIILSDETRSNKFELTTPHISSIITSVIALSISFFACYHLNDSIKNGAIMTAIVLLSVAGEIMIFLIPQNMIYLAFKGKSTNYIRKEMDDEEAAMYAKFVAKKEKKKNKRTKKLNKDIDFNATRRQKAPAEPQRNEGNEGIIDFSTFSKFN